MSAKIEDEAQEKKHKHFAKVCKREIKPPFLPNKLKSKPTPYKPIQKLESKVQEGITHNYWKLLPKSKKKWFSGSIRYSTTVKGLGGYDPESPTKETLNFSLNFNPYSYWFAGVTFLNYINPYRNYDYQPDFSYSFGYRDWHNDSFSFVYSNYANNKLFPQGNYKRFNFDEGVWDFSYKNVYKGINYKIGATYQAKNKQKRAYLNFNKKFLDNALLVSFNLTRDFKNSDTRASLGFNYVSDHNFYFTTKLYYYSDVRFQEDHEGDYAFSLGYKFDDPKITIEYSNYYMKTRYPWRKDGAGVDWKEGTVTINYNFRF